MSRINERFNVPKISNNEMEQKGAFEPPSAGEMPKTAKVSHLTKTEKANFEEARAEFNKNLPLGRVILSVIKYTNS